MSVEKIFVVKVRLFSLCLGRCFCFCMVVVGLFSLV